MYLNFSELLLICCLIAAWCYGCDEDLSTDDFISMVIDNLTAVENYVLPINNSKLMYLTSSTEDTSSYYGTFDFVIVGAGSAGTLLANRLTETNFTVLLLEAGGQENEFSDIPGMSNQLLRTDMNWGYYTVPQTTSCLQMTNNECSYPRGKVLGGSSVINTKMYVRGNKADYDYWEELGNTGWSYDDVLPYFIKTENSHISDGDDGYHGTDGLLDVNYTEPTIFTTAFLAAQQELGLDVVDYNGENQIGASQVQFTIKCNKIASGGRAFIDPFVNRTNLNVTINAFVTKLLIDTETITAYGVEFIANGQYYTVNASKEVILSAGAVNSPQILMLSGIGPAADLEALGIDVLVDLPVGQNLQDHPMFVGLNFRTNQTLFNETLETMITDYFKNLRPLTASANIDSVAFINVNDNTSTVPDIQQIMTVPPGNGTEFLNITDELGNLRPYRDIRVRTILLHPKSVGSITLKSSSPLDFPNIDYNFFSDSDGDDLATVVKSINRTLKLLETDAFKAINATLILAVDYCSNYTFLSTAYWECFAKYATITTYHPIATTKMGTSSNDSVVSPDLTVYGVNQLRVIDAGVMPWEPSGNINAATYMVAEKGADIIKSYYNVSTTA